MTCMSPSPYRLALLQGPALGAGQDGLAAATEALQSAAAAGAQVAVLPELFRSPYFCQTMDPAHFDLAESIPGPTTARLQEVAAACGIVIIASLFERVAPGLSANTTVVIDADGAYLGAYRKAHIPDDPSYLEKFYFMPGDTPYRAFDTRVGKIGVLICWDQWYPEAARLTAMQGASLIVYPTAIGRLDGESREEQERQRDAWITVQRGHAIANGVYVAAVNRAGREGALDFWGSSFVAGPQGELLAVAGEEGPETILVDINPARIEEVRRWWPFFRDRRVDTYSALTARWPRGES